MAKQAIRKLPGGLVVKKLSKEDSVKQGGAFAALAVWALIQVAYLQVLHQPCCGFCSDAVVEAFLKQ